MRSRKPISKDGYLDERVHRQIKVPTALSRCSYFGFDFGPDPHGLPHQCCSHELALGVTDGHLRSKKCWQGGLRCPVSTATGASAASATKINAG